MNVIYTVLSGFTNRDYAIVIWFFVLIIFALTKQEIRLRFYNLVKTILHHTVIIHVLLLFIYVAVQIYILDLIHLWDLYLTKDLLIWLFGFGLGSMIKTMEACRDKKFLINLLKGSLSYIILVEFIINLYAFPFVIEIFLIPFLFLLFGSLAYSELYEKYKDVRKFISIILSIIGVIIICYVSTIIFKDPKAFFTFENLLSFIFPIILSIMFLPYIYFFTLFVIYENLIVVVGGILQKYGLKNYFRKRLLLKYKLNLFGLINFNLHERAKFLNVISKSNIDKIFEGV